MDAVMRRRDPDADRRLLVGLRAKGETVDEITGFAEAMREHVVPVRPSRTPLVDVVGIAGDGARTINISTAAAIVAASAGAGVAKHGNRAASWPAAPPTCSRRWAHARSSPSSASPRRSTSSASASCSPARTIRRCAMRRPCGRSSDVHGVQPSVRSANPAGARDGVFGVYAPELARTYAEALAGLGARRALVVHGAGGVDELTPRDRRRGGGARGADHGVAARPGHARPRPLRPGGATRRRRRRERRGDQAVLDGERGGRRDAVVLNAGAVLVTAGVSETLHDGVAAASAAIDDGAAGVALVRLVEFSNAVPA